MTHVVSFLAFSRSPLHQRFFASLSPSSIRDSNFCANRSQAFYFRCTDAPNPLSARQRPWSPFFSREAFNVCLPVLPRRRACVPRGPFQATHPLINLVSADTSAWADKSAVFSDPLSFCFFRCCLFIALLLHGHGWPLLPSFWDFRPEFSWRVEIENWLPSSSQTRAVPPRVSFPLGLLRM